MNKFHIAQTNGEKGNVLVADDYFQAGTTILVEKAVIIFPKPDVSRKPTTYSGIFDERLTKYLFYREQSVELQQRVMSFFFPKEGNKLEMFKSMIEAMPAVLSKSVDTDEFLKLLLIMDFNCVEVSPQPLDGSTTEPVNVGSGLFWFSCRMSHSCNPNCFWFSNRDGDRVVRSIKHIEKNEELTVDYFNEFCFTENTNYRRHSLLQRYEFRCECTLCAEVGDRSRSFECFDSKCDGIYLASNNEVGSSLPCNVCGVHAHKEYCTKILVEENALQTTIKAIEDELDEGRGLITWTLQELADFPLFSSTHMLAYKLGIMKSELYCSPNELFNLQKPLITGERLLKYCDPLCFIHRDQWHLL